MQEVVSVGFKTIVVATDLSETSSAALKYARLIAAAHGSRVVLAHVIDPVSYANLSDVPQNVLAEMTESARGEMDRLAEEFLSAGIPSNSEVRQGVVTRLLLQVIDQYQADLVILGTHGAKGVGPVAVGTVAEQLVRLSPCPVMAVAADVLGKNKEELTGGAIVVPTEGNPAGRKATIVAQSLAAFFNGSLIVLYARTPEEALAEVDPCVRQAAIFEGEIPASPVPVRCLVRDGDAADVITDVANEFAAAMIVLGVNRESRSRTAHGTAYEVIARAKVPVLFVPPHKENDPDAVAGVSEAVRC